MKDWRTIRKTSVHIYVSFADTSSSDLMAKNIRLCVEPDFELYLDLTANLRTRSRSLNRYLDAVALAEGGIEELTLLQLDDNCAIDGIRGHLREMLHPPLRWKLTILLNREHSFVVEPEFKYRGRACSLLLRVIDPES